MKDFCASAVSACVPALAILLPIGLALGGCGGISDSKAMMAESKVRDSEIVATSHQAAEHLLHASQQPLGKDKPILVASLANVANMQQSSNLGRIISEQIATRLSQLGYETKEMKFRSSFFIKEGRGEFVLSRSIQDISQEQKAQAVVAGVYAVAKTSVYVTVRLIRADDSTVISAYDYKLPLGPDTTALLSPFDLMEY